MTMATPHKSMSMVLQYCFFASCKQCLNVSFSTDILWKIFIKSNSEHFFYSMSLTNLNRFRDTYTTLTVG